MITNWDEQVDLQNEQFITQTAYDALSRPISIIHPDSSEVSYVYDKGGLLQKVLKDATEHVTNITYNAKGQRENIYYGNNTKTRYYYNPLNFRLTRILTTRNLGQDVLQDLNYEFDAVGNITQIRDDAQQTFYFNNQVIAPVATFEYDALYRLAQATGRELTTLTAPTHNDFVNDIPVPNTDQNAMQNYTHNYAYDALGNILSDHWKTYQYATLNNYLLGNDNIANQYTYDAHGNMLTMPHLTSMGWDYDDRLFSAGNGTFTSFYNYDSSGNRTRKVVDKGNIVEERYYIGGYEVYRKYVNSSLDFERATISIFDIKVEQKELPKEREEDKPRMITKYEIDTNRRIVLIETKTIEDGQTLFIPEISTRYQYSNHLGSACLELDESGYLISYEEYHPFGTTSYRAGCSETEVSLKRYKYNGKEKDEETGLYYYGARNYAVWICKFVSVDPLKEKYPEFSPYVYCADNPVNLIDPDGRTPGVFFRFLSGKAGIGVGFAVSTTHTSGIAVDKQGITHFVAKTNNHVTNQNLYDGSDNPSVFLAGEVGISTGVSYNWKASSFIEAISDQSVNISIGGKAIVGGTVGFGEGMVSLSIGIGIGASIDVGKMTIVESISVSKSESKQISKMTDVITESWGIRDIKANYDVNGNINSYSGTVYTLNSKSNHINTGIIVKCEVKIDNGEKQPNQIWTSDAYNNK